MIVHDNAKLGPAGRRALTRAIADGMTQKAAAAAFCVSPATAHRWWQRWVAPTVGCDGRGAPVGSLVAASLQPSAPQPTASPSRRATADLRGSPADGLGSETGRGID